MNFVATVLSAVLLSLALPNELFTFGNPLIGFFCLAPYFWAISRTRKRGHAAALGFVFGVLSQAISSYWLYFFKDFAIWTIGSTALAYGFLHLLVALILQAFSRRPAPDSLAPLGTVPLAPAFLRPFMVAAVWTVWECLKSRGFLAYPWGLVAYAVNDVPVLTQIAALTGVYGLSFLLALVNALGAEILAELGAFPRAQWSERLRRLAPAGLVAAMLFACTLSYGAWSLIRPTPVAKTVPMVLVQHNGDSWDPQGLIDSLETCQRLSDEGKGELARGAVPRKPDLVVWSESVLTRPYEQSRHFYERMPPTQPFSQFLRRLDTPLVTGSPVILNMDTWEATNSALLIQKNGEVAFSYAKRHPVPFAEAIPFWEYAWMRDFMQQVIGLQSGWVMGTEMVIMEVPCGSGDTLRFGVPICFEDAFADLCAEFCNNGADILVNITNDSWSKTVSAEVQHFVAARFRTIENRRVLVRATNGGLTGVVDAEGRLVASLPFFVKGQLAVEVPIQRSARPTLYSMLGDWLPLLLALALFFRILQERVAARRLARTPLVSYRAGELYIFWESDSDH